VASIQKQRRKQNPTHSPTVLTQVERPRSSERVLSLRRAPFA